MHARTTWVLFLLALALGAYVVGVDRQRDTTAARRLAGRRAFSVKADRVTSVRVQVGELNVCAVREGDAPWMLTQPVRARAEASALRRLLVNLETLPRGEVITAEDRVRYGTTLDEYGLRSPRARIEVHEGFSTQTFLIGAPSSDGSSLYVQEATSDDIVSTSTNLLSALPATVGAWRDRTLFYENAARIQRVEIRRPDGFLQLLRRKDGQWVIQQPIAARADPLAVGALLDKLLGVRAVDFVQDGVENAAAFGIDETAMEVALTDDRPNGLSTTIRLGRPTTASAKTIYAWSPGDKNVYTVEADLLDVLRVKIDVLRSRVLLPLAVDKIRSIRYKQGEKELVLERTEDPGWMLTSPVKATADPVRVTQVLQDLQASRVMTFIDQLAVDPLAYGLGPDADLLVLSEGAAATHGGDQAADAATASVTVRLGRIDQGMRMVKVEGENALCEVPAADFKALSVLPIAFRSREVFQVDPDKVRRVRLKRDGVEETVARDTEGHFAVANVSGVRIASDTIRAQLEALRHLEAVRLVADQTSDLAAYGLDAPRAVMTLGLTGEAGLEKSILLGRPTEGGVFAMMRGQDLVFVIEPVLAKLLQQDLYVKQDAAEVPPPAP